MAKGNILSFLGDLKDNNDRDWFMENKHRYEEAQATIVEWLEQLIPAMSKYDQGLASIKPKDCLFRIYRDVRFSKDKSPYKTNLGAWIAAGGKKSPRAGYYLHLEPGNSFVAGGKYMPEADELKAIRQEVDYNFDEFKKIINAADFKKHFGGKLDGEQLKTLPKGYTADNPAIEYLKMKSFIAYKPVSDKEVNDKDFVGSVNGIFKAMKPLNDFLNRAMGVEEN